MSLKPALPLTHGCFATYGCGNHTEFSSCHAERQLPNNRWSWLLWSTRRPAWCAPWMLHQGRELALERAASRRLSAPGERFRRCISMQLQAQPAASLTWPSALFACTKASEAWEARMSRSSFTALSSATTWSTKDWQSSGLSQLDQITTELRAVELDCDTCASQAFDASLEGDKALGHVKSGWHAYKGSSSSYVPV